MNDDQMITLLRDTPLPLDDPGRYEAVVARGRRADRRRTTVVAAALAVIAVAGTATALTWPSRSSAGPQSFLVTTTHAGTARIVTHSKGHSDFELASGVVDFRHDAFELTLGSGDQVTTVREIGSDVWIKGSFASGLAGLGVPADPEKHWVHMPTGGASAFEIFNPAKTVAALQKVHATFDKVGTTSIEGVPVTDFKVTVPHDRNDTNATSAAENTGHLFVDHDGLVRRITGNGTGFELDFTDFGVPVDIEPPAKDDTTELPQGSFSGGTGTTMTGTTIEVTPQPMSPDTKARACQLIKDDLAKQTQIPQAKKDELIKRFCGP